MTDFKGIWVKVCAPSTDFSRALWQNCLKYLDSSIPLLKSVGNMLLDLMLENIPDC